LAGGRSRRFGRDKMQLDWLGQALRDHVVSRMVELSDDVLVLVAHDDAGTVADSPGVRYLRDTAEWPGPLVAVSHALGAAAHDVVLVVAGDMPVVPLRVLELLGRSAASSGAAVVGLEVDGEIQQVPVAVSRLAASDEIRALVQGGERRLGALRDVAGAAAVPEPEWRNLDRNGDSLRDIDTTDDLASLLRGPTDD
jgi:molybdopterin-guanine dinucleotide biosynthesis protein A